MTASGKIRKTIAASAILFLAILASPARAADIYSQWAHSGEIFLNTSADGANVTGTVTQFPLLVRLDRNTFEFRQAARDGRDIRFASSRGRHLPYQIDRWDSAKAVAEIWVLADTVFGNRADQYVRMHWGKPGAADSGNGNAVFSPDLGHMGVWHLGTEMGWRPNSVGGGQPASPQGFGNDPASPGVIGTCDSLDNDAGAEDHLVLYDDYTDFSKGFSFEVWAYPTAVTTWARLMDFGNGPGQQNIVLSRQGTTDNLIFHIYSGTTMVLSSIAGGALALNQWQHFAVTVSGLVAKTYRNGVLLKQDTLSLPIPAVRRAYQYIGKSNWTWDGYYQGKIDEPRLSMVARSSNWVKLSYANQRPDQRMSTFGKTFLCTSKYAPPRDTSLAEGRLLELSAQAECATGYTWSTVSGSAPRILDPEVKTLQVNLPRVTRDEILTYRFVARFPDSVRTKDVRVTVRETIPDPVFTLNGVPTWTGVDSLVLKPVISNLAAVKATRDSVIFWNWTVAGLAVDTVWRKDALVLRKPVGTGKITVGLCLHNSGPSLCKQVNVDVNPVSIRSPWLPAPAVQALPQEFRDAAGRMRKRFPEESARFPADLRD